MKNENLHVECIQIGAELKVIPLHPDEISAALQQPKALAGSIMNNGIVLIDKIEENIHDGQMPYDAVVNSGCRPIQTDPAVSVNHHDPLFYGMASVMFFGLGTGSMFTLNYVPVLYSIFFKVKQPADQIPG